MISTETDCDHEWIDITSFNLGPQRRKYICTECHYRKIEKQGNVIAFWSPEAEIQYKLG